MNVVSVYIDKLLNQQSFALLARMMVDCCHAPLPHTVPKRLAIFFACSPAPMTVSIRGKGTVLNCTSK